MGITFSGGITWCRYAGIYSNNPHYYDSDIDADFSPTHLPQSDYLLLDFAISEYMDSPLSIW